MLTLIKKKIPSVPDGEALSTQPLAPRPAPASRRLPLAGAPGVIRFRWGRGALPQVVPLLPGSLSRAPGRWALKEVSSPGGFPSAEELNLTIRGF